MSVSANPSHENHIPAAVRAQAERANELLKATTQPAEEVTPEVTPEATPEMPTDVVTSVAEQPPLAATPPKNDEQTWEQRFRSEQGRTQALRREVNDLQRTIAELEAQLTASANAAPSFDAQGASLITPEEENDYGKDLLNVVGKRAKEVAAPMEQKINELEAKLKGLTASRQVSSRQEMFSDLDKTVPNWREINSNQKFLDWLEYPDEFTGQKRFDLLQSAYNSNSASRTAAFFERFLGEATTVAPQATAEPAPTKPSLDQFAAPGRAKPVASTKPADVADKPYIKASDIAQFYTDVAKGKYRGKEGEKAQIDAMIAEAGREGRVIQ